jgi:hypothetical protein
MAKIKTLTGQFTLTTNVNPVNGVANTGIFDPLIGVPLGYKLSFEIASETLVTDPFSGEMTRKIATKPVTIKLTGSTAALVATTIPSTLNGATMNLRLSARAGAVLLDDFNFVGTPLNEYFGFELVGGVTGLSLDAAGFPKLGPFDIADSSVMLRRYVTPFAMTDFAIGPASIKYK